MPGSLNIWSWLHTTHSVNQLRQKVLGVEILVKFSLYLIELKEIPKHSWMFACVPCSGFIYYDLDAGGPCVWLSRCPSSRREENRSSARLLEEHQCAGPPAAHIPRMAAVVHQLGHSTSHPTAWTPWGELHPLTDTGTAKCSNVYPKKAEALCTPIVLASSIKLYLHKKIVKYNASSLFCRLSWSGSLVHPRRKCFVSGLQMTVCHLLSNSLSSERRTQVSNMMIKKQHDDHTIGSNPLGQNMVLNS